MLPLSTNQQCHACKHVILSGSLAERDDWGDAFYHPGTCWGKYEEFLDRLEALEKSDIQAIPFELWAPPLP